MFLVQRPVRQPAGAGAGVAEGAGVYPEPSRKEREINAELCRTKVPDRIPLRFRPESYHLWCFEDPGHAGPHRATFGEKDWNLLIVWSDPE